jgi:Leucine-rich repeat (LRR) protein
LSINQASAWELNSGNIGSYCGTTRINCNLSNKSPKITSIAKDTFVNYPNLEELNLSYNQISSIES